MLINVLYFGLIRHKTGKKQEEFQFKDGSSLADLFDLLAGIYGRNLEGFLKNNKESRLDPTFVVTLNGKIIEPNRRAEIILKNKDTVSLMTLISGG